MKWTASACAWLAGACPSVSMAGEPTLEGCWRSQHAQVSFADIAPSHQNADCVGSYANGSYKLQCQRGNTTTDTSYTYRIIRPGRMQVAMTVPAYGQPLAPPFEADYRVDGDWIVLSRTYDPAVPRGKMAHQPTQFSSLAVRVDTAKEACKPRGDTGLRIGKSPFSALALVVPLGWAPNLKDPASDAALGKAVGQNFFVGAFAREEGTAHGPARGVLVLDDFRYGPTPVREAQFVAVKRRFFSETEGARKACDLPERACAFLEVGKDSLVYTELLLVRGRVAVVHVTADSRGSDTEKNMRDTARAFTESLQRSNP